MEAIQWNLRTGAPWRDALPKRPMPLENGLQSFQLVVKKRVMGAFFLIYNQSIDEERIFADESYIRGHQHSSGARRGELRATGKSQGGTTTKINLAVDSHGNPVTLKSLGMTTTTKR